LSAASLALADFFGFFFFFFFWLEGIISAKSSLSLSVGEVSPECVDEGVKMSEVPIMLPFKSGVSGKSSGVSKDVARTMVAVVSQVLWRYSPDEWISRSFACSTFNSCQ
jgi:hypothetical protein